VGTAGGVTFMLQDRSGGTIQFLAENLKKFVAEARKRPEIASITTPFVAGGPRLYAHVNRGQALQQGVPLERVCPNHPTFVPRFMGGVLRHSPNRLGRPWRGYVQAEGEFRPRADQVGQFRVLNSELEQVPLSALVTMDPTTGPEFTMRFNQYRAVQLNVNAK